MISFIMRQHNHVIHNLTRILIVVLLFMLTLTFSILFKHIADVNNKKIISQLNVNHMTLDKNKH